MTATAAPVETMSAASCAACLMYDTMETMIRQHEMQTATKMKKTDETKISITVCATVFVQLGH